jgi:hypothetical protein
MKVGLWLSTLGVFISTGYCLAKIWEWIASASWTPGQRWNAIAATRWAGVGRHAELRWLERNSKGQEQSSGEPARPPK